MARQFTFIGVTTGGSSIMRIFPRWRDLLELDAYVEIVGWDVPIHASPAHYRQLVATLKEDPANLGALVTTHKIDLYQAACDLFDEIDPLARLCGEVSCLAKHAGRLAGYAKDPISAGRTLDGILGPAYFGRTGGHVLCLGAGGAGIAIILHLLTRPADADRPARLVVVDRDGVRLADLQTRLGHLPVAASTAIEYVESADPAVADSLVAALPPASLAINATGMGKDVPGSPLTGAVLFPVDTIAWELNYRGSLEFLHQARAQRESRRVRVEDGWSYFIHGWTTVIEEVFGRSISPHELPALTRAAEFARPALWGSGQGDRS